MNRRRETRVLAIDPTSRGFGFVLFEDPTRLVDWGVAHVRAGKRSGCLKRVAELMSLYHPTIIVIEDFAAGQSRRCSRVRELLRAVVRLAEQHLIRSECLTKKVVRNAFSGETWLTKHAIAKMIAFGFPELAPRLPPPRKPWMSEDERMSIFDAAALAITFFAR